MGGQDTELRGCTFLGNFAGYRGGGLISGMLAVDCVFSGNGAGTAGGGVYFTPVVANCTFSGNFASAGGGFAGGAEWWVMQLSNCILWGNRDASGSTQGAQLTGFCRVDDGLVEGWDGRHAGSGTFGADPLFVSALGADGIAGTLDDDLRLDAGSPGVDTASSRADAGDGFDALGQPRFVDSLACDGGGILDRGAIERRRVEGTTVFCASAPSSLGVPAEIGGPCVVSLSTDGVTRITAAPVPARCSAVLLLGTPGSPQPFGDGNLCLARSMRRSAAVEPRNGTVAFDVYTWTQEPGATVGLQVQFRDPRPGGSGFNLSSAMRLLLLP